MVKIARSNIAVSDLSASANQWHFLMALLTAIYALAFVDRQVVNILAERIKVDLDLTDWQIGALAGPAFALFYVLAGVPLARLAEHRNRVYLLSGILTIWSGFTALSGLAFSFVHLLVARILVGASEAGCVPCAHSLISDMTPRSKRATALAVFSMGLPLGSLIGLAAGGFIADHFSWRAAFFIVGAPGLIFAALLYATVADPRADNARGLARIDRLPPIDDLGSSQPPTDDLRVPPFRNAMRCLLQTRSFIWMTVAASSLSLAGYGQATFYASFFLRNHAEEISSFATATHLGGSLAFLGLTLGLAIGITGMIGTALGGRLGDKCAAASFKGYLRIPVVATAVGTPLTIAALLVHDAALALMLLASASLLKSMWYGPVFATIQGLVGSRSRATAVSVFLTIMNGIGMGLGPLALGALSDALGAHMGNDAGLRWAMVITTLPVFFSAFCFWRAERLLPDKSIS
ncbi:MAG: MFS transporter [Sphingomonas sp.]|nr:MFS transporter [Sphingomonas sp.]